MESAFAERRFEAGVVQGIDEVSALLAAHYPSIAGVRNELPDKPVVL
jgi:uncharacterized membrane protein